MSAISQARRLSAAAGCAVVVSLGGLAAAVPASAAAAPQVHSQTPAATTYSALRTVQVPASSISPALRTRLAASGVAPATTYTGYLLANDTYPADLCLDANDAGSTAGKNGDKVQLWTCDYTPNQIWIPLGLEENPAGGPSTIMVNDEYGSMCLNADDSSGLANGKHVQLWECDVYTDNEYWNFGDMLDGSSAYLGLYSSPYVLDATEDGFGNGDQVQIWTPLGGANQYWIPYDASN